MSRRGANADQFETNQRVFIKLFRFVFFVFLFSCSSDDSNPNVTILDARDGSASLEIAPSTSERIYLALPFSAPPQNPTGTAAFQLQLKSQTELAKPTKAIEPSPLAGSMNYQSLLDQVKSEQNRHAMDRTLLNQVTAQSLISIRSVQRPITNTISIFSPFSGEENQTITGKLRASSATTAVYIDSRDNLLVTNEQVQTLLYSYNSISLPRLHALFGKESDEDNNKVVILFLAGPNRIGSGELGFFRPVDLLPDGAISGVRSNEGEIVYARIPNNQTPLVLVNATLAHETFHLINFGLKTLPLYQQTGGAVLMMENLALNEGLAHLAEELTGWSTCTSILTKIYLDCFPQTSLYGPGAETVANKPFCDIAAGGGDSLPRRGGMMLFLLYLFQQEGGATYSKSDAGSVTGAGITFLQALQTSQLVGIENLERGSGRKFFNMYAQFVGALGLDKTGVTPDPRYNFEDEVLDSFTQMTRNIRIRGTRIDPVDASTIVLVGPVGFETISAGTDTNLTGSLFSSGASVLQLKIPANLSTNISFSGDKALAMGLTLVQLQ